MTSIGEKMMTDKELIDAVATKIMGWIKKDFQYWIIELSTAKFPDGSAVNTEYFTMFVSPGINPFWMPQGSQFFDPINNANHWMMVVERMRLSCRHVELYSVGSTKNWLVIFDTIQVWDKDLGRTICLAALKMAQAQAIGTQQAHITPYLSNNLV